MDAPSGGAREASLGVDLGQLAPDELGVGRGGEPGQGEMLGMARCERLGDGHRPVDELLGRGQNSQRYSVAGKFAQRERRLESGDAASGDQGRQPLVTVGSGRSVHETSFSRGPWRERTGVAAG